LRTTLKFHLPRGPAALRRDVFVVTPSYVVPGLATLISVPLLFQLLGAAAVGVYFLVFAVANGVPLMTGSWLEEITLRYGHRPDARIGNRHLLFSILLSMLVAAALAAVLIPTATPILVLVTATSSGAVSAYLVTIARLQSALRFGLVSVVAAGRATVGTVLAIAVAAVTGDPVAAAAGLAVGFVAAAGLGLAAERPMTATTPTADAPASQPLLGYGLSSSVGATALYIASVGDRFVLSNSRTLDDVGRYAAIYAIVDLGFRLVPSVLLSAVRPRLFRAWDSGEQVRGSRLLAAYSGVLAWLLGAGVLAVMVAGPAFPAVPLEIVIAGPVALGLQMFVLAQGLSLLLSAGLRQARLAGHLAITAMANVAMNLLLVPTFGAPAAALVTAISFAIYLLLNATALDRDGLLPDTNATRLIVVSIAAPALAVLAAVGGQPLIGVLAGAAGLAAALPLIRAVLTASPELIDIVRPAK
jgi:O-antigen/teichoic acid export membrane protein